MKSKKNICKILAESYKWRNRELLTEKGTAYPKLTYRKIFRMNVIYFLFSLGVSFLITDLFKEKITTFLITSLSIFIGLFISILILIFDKFLNVRDKFNSKKKNVGDERANFIRTRNFTRRFVFVLLEALITAFVIIILLLPSLVFESDFLEDILDYKFCTLSEIKRINIWTFFENLVIILIKSVSLTLLIRFSFFLFYLFGALGEYMKGVLYGKVDI